MKKLFLGIIVLLMGHFSIFTKDITVVWANKCEFSWEATFYLEDVTGSNTPTLKDLKGNVIAFLYDASIHYNPYFSHVLKYTFASRTVVMGEWIESGTGCCDKIQ
ncbi:MAG: hypothetical protein K6B46_00120 [Opitutales bacterium]|nr:hypothetical protein [Opitutales bacterium]